MPVDVATSLAALRIAIEAGRALVVAEKAWDKAELKLKVAGLVDALTDARQAISDLNDDLRAVKDERDDLRRRLADVAAMTFEAPFYWKREGEVRDGPFCQRCFDVDNKVVHLIDHGRGVWLCKGCQSTYSGPDRERYVAEDDAKLRARRSPY